MNCQRARVGYQIVSRVYMTQTGLRFDQRLTCLAASCINHPNIAAIYDLQEALG
jgi:hypothetical protein